MFDFFKKDVAVKCRSWEEVGKLLNWLRVDSGLAELNRQRYSVTAVMAMQYWDNPDELLHFEVNVPYSKYKKIREAFIQRESFDEILQMRPIAEIILDRDSFQEHILTYTWNEFIMKMQLAYAQQFITKGYAGHWRTVSCHDDVLVIEDLEEYQSCGYLGTKLNSGQLQTDAQGFVIFTRVKPIIDQHTRFSFP